METIIIHNPEVDKNIDNVKTARGFVAMVAKDMISYEQHKMVLWHRSDREAAMLYILRCLANPACEGSQEALDAIMAKREGR